MVLFVTLLVVSILFRKAFCGWLWLIGTISERLWRSSLAVWQPACNNVDMTRTFAAIVLALTPAYAGTPARPNPRWKVHVLVYTKVDFSYSDSAGQRHHVTTAMTPEEQALAIEASKRFFESDVPTLNGGAMKPVLTIAVRTQPLTRLTPICGGTGYWPFPDDIGPDVGGRYDSVVAIWTGKGWDSETNSPAELGCYGGLAFYRGTNTAFSTFTLAVLPSTHRNAFKHEWGHSILFYYDAAGTAPKPPVDNHIGPGMYVHCGTGTPYVLIDEDDAGPVPNSIYNNRAGFTRDYYSGQTALTGQPTACLGVTPQAWASGGPVTRPIPFPGDLNGDRLVNRTDLSILVDGIGKPPSGPNDPRDLDYDGAITVLDARMLSLLCSKPYCAL